MYNMTSAFIPPFASPIRGSALRKQRRRPVCTAACTKMAATPSSNHASTYAASGVDIALESSSIASLLTSLGPRSAVRKPGTSGALLSHTAGFSGLIEFGDSLLALCTDGVGSKLLLAAELAFYDTVPLDCVAMNVNDLLCIGAEPLAFVDYIAAPKPDPYIWAALGRGLGEACRRARVSLCGGETASLPDIVSHIDLSGTALGALPRGMQLDGAAVSSGDLLVGLPASGLHSNGFSLVRTVLKNTPLSLSDEAPFHVDAVPRADGPVWRHAETTAPVTLGEVLLNPTKIYVDPLVDLFLACREGRGPCSYSDLHAVAHITGGGLSNLLRLKKGLGFHVATPLPVLPEFEWLQRVGQISHFEMYRTFNMGMGMCLVVAESAAAAVQSWLAERLPGTSIVGDVNSTGIVSHVIDEVRFNEY